MSVTLSNTTAQLSGKEVLVKDGTHTITGAITFDKDPAAPFAVTSGSAVVTNLDADKLDGVDSTGFVQTPNGTAVSPTINTTLKSTAMFAGFCQGRLTLTTATPVTIADVTGATTMYFTPYNGNLLALYNGTTTWTVYPFTEISLALGTLTSGLPYDVFVYDNAGTPTLEFLAWTNGTTRATALVLQNGVLSKTGALTRRYLGTFYTTSTTATEDSFAKRFVWNYYNRVPRALRRLESTASWTYTTATVRQANAAAANQLDVVVGVAEVMIEATLTTFSSNTNADIARAAGFGEDSTSTLMATQLYNSNSTLAAATGFTHIATIRHYPAVGRHFYSWNEISTATGTTTWFGVPAAVGNPNGLQSGILGWIDG